ncbi:MAG: hypothetical protein NTW32_19235 [Chloroflexi bacterium]|nr:hypothetical protein [Chloroflexota bacterium]
MSNKTIPLLLLTDSIIGAFFVIFAPLMGLDPNNSWGKFRVIALCVVISIFLLSISTFLMSSNGKNVFSLIIKSNKLKIYFAISHVWLIIFVIYVWFITYGNLTTWNRTTHYYTQLADAFTKGNLYVERKPGNALIQAFEQNNLANLKSFDTEIWDMSLYKDRLYLYWGPVPALVAIPLQTIFKQKIADNYLVFIFSAGLLVVNSLIIVKLRGKFFPGVPISNLIACILIIGLITPVVWFSSTPYVYSTAIVAGQFFLMGGYLFVLSIFEKEPHHLDIKLFLAGLFWVCSVASRAVNAFSVIFFVLIIMFWYTNMIYKLTDWKGIIRRLLPLFVPMLIGAFLIGWYNWARFESPLEFGLRYQITIYDLKTNANFVFHPDYFFLNVFTQYRITCYLGLGQRLAQRCSSLES